MTDPKNLASRFREPLLDGKWIANTNLKAQLAEVDVHLATKKINSLNSIAALTFHLDYYIAGVLQAFNGGSLDIRDKYSFDMPAVVSEQDWTDLQEKLWSDVESFALAVEEMTADQLNAVFVDEKYGDYRRNIEGMIEHAYYHLGQVVLIKKLLTEQA
ncbi:MAG: hypothetical protein R8G66_15875 [Cytophagales bacterium]|nr:hypothetical protein [Cytophagales bacterium]